MRAKTVHGFVPCVSSMQNALSRLCLHFLCVMTAKTSVMAL